MLGKTHVTVGVAAALAIMQPASIAECVATIGGGALGGWICDVDIRENENKKIILESTILLCAILGAFLCADKVLQLGVMDYIKSSNDTQTMLGSALFFLMILVGGFTKHRSFTHSICGFVVYTTLLHFAYPFLAAPFAIGSALHIALDILNKKGVQLFFPLKKRICFGLCEADGKANFIINSVAAISAIIMGAWFIIAALPNSGNFS